MKKLSFLLAIVLLASSFLMTACKKQVPPEEPPTTTPALTAPPAVDEQPVVYASITAEQLAKYEIIYAKDSSKEVKSEVQKIPNIVFDAYEIILNQRTDLSYEGVASLAKGQYEILIGNTNREESATFLSNLKWDDYGYGIVGDKLVIAGKNEDGTLKALRAFLEHIKGNTGEVFFTNQNQLLVKKQYPYSNITINGIAATDLAILCNQQELGGVAQIIRDAIIEACGIAVPIVTDNPAEDSIKNKIVIGHTDMIIIDEAPDDIAYPTGKEFYISMLAGGIFVDANTMAGYYSAAAYIDAYLSPGGKGGDVVVLEQGKHIGEDALPVMSFNLMAGSQSNPESKRVDAVVETILKYRPAVVGVQEATDTWIALLNQRLGNIYTIVGDGRNETRGDEHSAILYLTAEFDCIESGTKWLSDTPDVPGSKFAESHYTRIMTYVHLSRKSDGEEFLHVNTHLDYGTSPEEESVKFAQIEVLFSQIEKFANLPIIITGDFNATVDSPVYNRVIEEGYTEVAYYISAEDREPTYHALMGTTGESSHIDFVFYKRVHSYVYHTYYRICTERVDNENVSDHYPIFAVLVFRPEGK